LVENHGNPMLFSLKIMYIYHIIHKVCNSLKTPLTQSQDNHAH